MIIVTRLNGKPITINALLIETIEETPDTLLTLTTGKKIMVLEKMPAVINLVQHYMFSIGSVKGTIMSSDSRGA